MRVQAQTKSSRASRIIIHFNFRRYRSDGVAEVSNLDPWMSRCSRMESYRARSLHGLGLHVVNLVDSVEIQQLFFDLS